MSARTHFVYTAYDKDGAVLYVGCTGNPEQRYRSHMGGHEDARGWFNPYVTRWHVSGPYPKHTALRIEKQRIAALQPVFNGMSAGNRFRNEWGTYERRMADAYLRAQRAATREQVAA